MTNENGANSANESRQTSRIVGEILPIERTLSGLWSWDRAIGFRGELGTPDRGIIELYGNEHTGKTSLACYLVGRRSSEADLVLCDYEGAIDPYYLEDITERAGHSGNIRYIASTKKEKGKTVPRKHEAMIQDAINSLVEENVASVIVDSYGAFTSHASREERKKDIGKRTVGQEAKTLNNVAKDVQSWLRALDVGKWWFVINHTNPNIGGPGFNTPGGRKTKYLAIARAWIRRKANDWPEGSGNFVAEIAFQKLKYGIKGGKCWVYFIPGFGVSPEMTAVYECIQLKLAQAGATVKLEVMDGEDKEWKWMSQGRIGTLAKKALDPQKNAKTFKPFFDALERYGKENA